MNVSSATTPLIVVGVDGSPSSVAALRFAKTFAEGRHARLRAVASWMPSVSLAPPPPNWSQQKDAEFLLRVTSKDVFGNALPEWYEKAVREGSAALTLIEESAAADLLIVGSRGHGGFAGLLLGSVSSQCAAHAHCVVIIIHASADDGGRPSAVDRSMQSASVDAGRIVVGHDGSVNADDALDWALDTAEVLGAPVEVVRTWSVDRIPRQFTEEKSGFVPSFDEVTARVCRDLEAGTRGIVERHPAVAVTVSAAVSQPAEKLIDLSNGARMIVVGSRGRGGFAGLLLGSVSAECAAHAACPVAVVPARTHVESAALRATADASR